MLQLLETKDTRCSPQGGENHFKLGAVLIEGRTPWAVLAPGWFCLVVHTQVLTWDSCAVPALPDPPSDTFLDIAGSHMLLKSVQVLHQETKPVPLNLICLNIKAKENH